MSDIVGKIRALKQIYIDRDQRIREYYDMRRIEPEDIKNYEAAKVNDPKNIVRLGTYLLSAVPAKHRIPAMGEESAEVEKAALVERALGAAWREQDVRRRRSGQRLWRWAFADYLVMTGWYAVLMNVRERDDKRPQFIAEVWNPGRTYPEWDGDDLISVAYEYDLAQQSLEPRAKKYGWDVPIQLYKAKNARVTQLWELEDSEEVFQSIVVGASVVQDRKHMEGLKRIPILVGATSGEGAWGGSYDNDVKWSKYYGEGILEASFEMIKQSDRFLTYLMQNARDAAQSPVVHKRGAAGNVTPAHLEGQSIMELPAPQEDVERLEPSHVPPALAQVLGLLGEKVQQGGFVWSLFGSTGAVNLSGFAIQQLLTSAYATVGEYFDTVKSVMADVDQYWLEAYRDGSFGPMVVMGRKPHSSSLVKEEVSPDLIPDDVMVEVEFSLAAPKDTFERMAAARQAHPSGDIMDLITTLDEIVGADDPITIRKRLDDESTSEVLAAITEPLKAIEVLRRKERAVREGVNPDSELADMIKQAWMGMLANLGGGQGGQQLPAPPGTSTSPPEARGEPRNVAERLGVRAPQGGRPEVSGA